MICLGYMGGTLSLWEVAGYESNRNWRFVVKQLSSKLVSDQVGESMQLVANQLKFKELDELLDELDRLSESSSISSGEFFHSVLDRLRHLVSADSVLLLIQLQDECLSPLARSGDYDWTKTVNELAPDVIKVSPHFLSEDRLLIFPFDVSTRRSLLLLRFSSGLDHLAKQDLMHLVNAFVDILSHRFRMDEASFQSQYLGPLRTLIGNIRKANCQEEADLVLVNDLLPVLKADRVSLGKQRILSGVRVAAVNNHLGPVIRSEAVRQIEAICEQVIQARRPSVVFPHRTATSSTGISPGDGEVHTFPCYTAIPLQDDSQSNIFQVLVIEWQDPDAFCKGSLILQQAGFVIAMAWNEHERWLRIPALIRKLQLPVFSSTQVKRLAWLSLLVITTLLGYWLLTKPTQLRIEMNGIVEPRVQRNVYAMLDGIIEKIEIPENQRVSKGQILLTMRSPALDMQIKEVMGELNANREKRDAIALGINQIKESQAKSITAMNSLIGQMRQLEIQRDTLSKKLVLLTEQAKQLTIYSPIDGVVVAQDLDKLLDARPVRQGDPLFKIVDPQSAWNIHLEIADSDVGYVKRKVFQGEVQSGAVTDAQNYTIDFVFISDPNQRFQGYLEWIAESARNPRGDGVFVDAIAAPQAEAVAQAHLGATVKVFLHCGEYPLWFVFSRSLVESIQRKLWF